MTRPPTDFKLLKTIHDRHYNEYASQQAKPQREVFVPIDIPAIAEELGTDKHSVFGRLYYHLEEVYGTNEPGQPRKSLFAPRLGHEANCINFPLLEAVLASLWEQRNRDRWTYLTSTVSLGISIASLVVSMLVATGKLG